MPVSLSRGRKTAAPAGRLGAPNTQLRFPGDSGVKKPPAVQETQEAPVRSLGGEDPLEEGVATRTSILPGNPRDRGAWQATAHGVTKSDTSERLSVHTCDPHHTLLTL